MATKPASAETLVMRLQQEISGPADAAIGALGRLEAQIAREQKALGRLETDLVSAKSKLSALAEGSLDSKAVSAFERQGKAVSDLESKIKETQSLMSAGMDPKGTAKAQASIQQLTGKLSEAKLKLETLGAAAQKKTFDQGAYDKQRRVVETLTDKIGAQRDKIGGLREKSKIAESAMKQLGGAAQFLGQQSGLSSSAAVQLGSSLAVLGPIGAVVAASFLVTGGVIAVLVGMFAKAVGAAGQMRDEFLNLQAASVQSVYGFGWLHNSLRASTGAALQMRDVIDSVSASTSVARGKLADYTTQLWKWGMRAKNLEKGVAAIATVDMATNGQLTQSAMNMIKMYGRMGLSVDAIAERIRKKFGDVASQKALSLSVQMQKLGENMKRIWGAGRDEIEPLLKALGSVLGFLNAGTPASKSLEEAIRSMTEKGVGLILDLTIAVLETYIAIRSNEKAWKSLKLVVLAAGIGLAVVTAITIGLTAALGVMLFTTLLVAGAWAWVGFKIGEAIDKIRKLDFAQLGSDMVMGIANGILKGDEMIWNALKSVVGGAIAKVKNLLDSHSPSKVFERIGASEPQGMAIGIEKDAPKVAHATAKMVSESALASSGNSVKGSKEYNFNNCTFGAGIDESFIRQLLRTVDEEAAFATGAPA